MGSQIGALFGGLFGDAGQNFVDLQGGPDAVFGRKPDVAPFVPVDLSAETGKAVGGDLQNYDAITSLLNKIIPGFSDQVAQASANTTSELKGEIPQDVQDAVMRSSAFQSLQGGYAGTGMSKALTARDLGTTSLNLTQLGNNSAQVWTDIAEKAYSPFTVSTSEQAGTTAANNAGKQATDQFQFNVDAAPDPGAAGIFNLDKELGQQMLSFGLGAAGGAIAGGGAAAGAVAPAGQSNAATTANGLYRYDPASGQYVPASGGTTGAWSDRRLKRNWFLVGSTETGINIYEFEYAKPEGCASIRFIGVMAQEVQEICPGAVVEIGGYLCVDYDELGIKMEVAA